MAEIKASHRIIKSAEEDKRDFYITPPPCTRALVDFFERELQLPKDISVLDPCCGEGHISNELRTYFKEVDEMDLFDSENPLDFLASTKVYNAIIENQPYSQKYTFLDHSFKLSNLTTSILPMQIVNYNMFHRDYLDIPSYVGRVLLTPKIIMGDSPEIKRGGVSSYAWFIWDKYNKTSKKFEWYRDIMDFT